jgi:hypothetical protein
MAAIPARFDARPTQQREQPKLIIPGWKPCEESQEVDAAA